MQNFVLHKKLYQLNKIDESSYSEVVYKRYEILRLYKKLRAEGSSESTAMEALGVCRSTFFRWAKRYKELGLEGLQEQSRTPKVLRMPLWNGETKKTILKLRKKYPLFGKNKLAVMLTRETGKVVPASTIGRILKKLLKKDLIKPAMFHLMAKFPKKPRLFTGHAQRWKYHMRPSRPGEMLQIDHMRVTLNGKSFKHFNAICPITKITFGQVYTDATSYTASQFLQELRKVLPFELYSIQVDGGSEFMASFEKCCEDLGIPLYVLPPKRPQYNAHVERGNGTAKYEFYYQYDGPIKLESIRPSLKSFNTYYNSVRPHQSINYLTPLDYYDQLTKEVRKSHM